MTNLEYLSNLASDGDIGAVAKMMYDNDSCTEQWCLENKDECCSHCRECFVNWLRERRAEPMPELVPGMFVKTRSIYTEPEDDDEIGVIIPHEKKGYVIVYNHYGFDDKSDVESGEVIIKEIYNTSCFNGCDKTTRIWKKEN